MAAASAACSARTLGVDADRLRSRWPPATFVLPLLRRRRDSMSALVNENIGSGGGGGNFCRSTAPGGMATPWGAGSNGIGGAKVLEGIVLGLMSSGST